MTPQEAINAANAAFDDAYATYAAAYNAYKAADATYAAAYAAYAAADNAYNDELERIEREYPQ